MSTQTQTDPGRLVRVAKNQRAIMLCILAQLGLWIFGFVVPVPAFVLTALSLVVGLASLFFTLSLARCVYGIVGTAASGAFLLAPIVGSFAVPALGPDMPIVILLTLAVVNQRATKELRAAGFKVGLLGANPADVAARAASRRSPQPG